MHYIALDLGGSNIRYAVFKERMVTPSQTGKRPFIHCGDPCQEIEQNICNLIEKYADGLKGIGLSLAANVDRYDGTVSAWPNNPCWEGYQPGLHLEKTYQVPVKIEDDANCGALGEYYMLNHRPKNMIYLSIGTGLGCGLILNSRLFIGENGFAGELGHVDTGTNNLCTCGQRGCLQAHLSGPAIVNDFCIACEYEEAGTLEQVVALCEDGNKTALLCMEKAVEYACTTIFNLVMCLDIPYFVIGGGASQIGEIFIRQVSRGVNDKLRRFKREAVILAAKLGEYSGVYGAYFLFTKKLKQDG